ncbi:hypothetical protein MJ923_14740 [Shewanella sp. 3B26]|uniref:Uncharacterized protein n=1 Tax=Shewanella zhuhaiensis TaxID=2919576 RepID=A0AAJ1F1I8_9GAMM|nr:hypothetical protein [Shewanella zhuhaiensis]MCH4295563.1 hypothetical protein [Shewanella zhuhaiensis]
MPVTILFDESWPNASSPLDFSPVVTGVSPQFDEPWLNARSPVSPQFGGGTTPEPVDDSIGIQVGIAWADFTAAEQQLLLASESVSFDTRAALAWQAQAINTESAIEWDSPLAEENRCSLSQDNPASVRQSVGVDWDSPETVESQSASEWQTMPPVRDTPALAWSDRPSDGLRHGTAWLKAHPVGARPKLAWFSPPAGVCSRIRWGIPERKRVCSNQYRKPKSPITILFDEPYGSSVGVTDLRFDTEPMVCEWVGGGGLIDGPPILPPLNLKIPIEPQIRRSYLMTPQITCIRMTDQLPIVLRSVSIQHSRSQWACTCNMVFSSKGDADRAAGQSVRLTVNGYDFYLVVGTSASSERFGQATFTASGRGLLAELATPYKKAVNYTNQVARSFLGLASDIVANTGWNIASAITDYNVPATAWSYAQKTPAEALNMMASSIGAMLDVDGETRTITFIPRWPVSPWATDTATPDVVLHDSVILEMSEREDLRSDANAVFVRGEQLGVAARVKRFGTAGDAFSGDIVEKLITDNQAARMRGTHELAEAGSKLQTQIRTKLMADLPPIRPGMLVGVRRGASLFKAVCDSWQLNAAVNGEGKVVVNQSLTLLRNAA